ncbi:alpha/beta fold hydrolase [Mycolicibacterium novocastrense]|uniref:alpha/beta fold hydrolase n=1 Tax=Mycolicibacterium novocastrense TaxID=59813 RepID=UPI0009EC64A9|nr:alpha/beta hydrolase [Mycolicibacterium novocastrense]
MTLGSATEDFIDVDGIRTHYWEEGSGHPVLLIHGGGAGADAQGNWAGCWKTFSGQFRTIAYDMLGYGGTLADQEDFVYSQDARVEHLRGFLDAKGLEKVSLVGNSMGGAAALGLAIHHPERVHTLTLMGSAGQNPRDESGQVSSELLTILNYREPDQEAMRRIVDTLTHDNFVPSDEMVQYRYRLTQDEKVMHAYNGTMAWNMKVGGLRYEDQDIAKVEVPTLVVSGREDAVVPLRLSLRFHQLIPNSTLHSIPHCGHWAMIEHPLEFSDLTTRFIREEVAS